MTQSTQRVLAVLLAEPTKEFYGLEVCEAAGFPSGTIHPILARLEAVGWVESRWEEVDPREIGRPRRRYYSLTARGGQAAAVALRKAEAGRPRLRPGLAGGVQW